MSSLKKIRSKIKEKIKEQDFYPGFLGIFINSFYFARHGLCKNIGGLSHFLCGKTLDIGCGQMPYRKLFNTTEYIGMDIKKSGHDHSHEKIDVFYDGKTFPFEDNVFDSALSNEVLEHVFNPDEHLSEIYRVLKPGGKLLLSVPFLWNEHEQPYDYARYSYFGLRHLLEKNGFKILEHRKSSTGTRAVFQMANVYLHKITSGLRKKIHPFIVTTIFNAPFNILGIILDLVLPKSEDLYLDNIIVAQK